MKRMKMTHHLYVFYVAILFVVPTYAQESAKNSTSPNPVASPSVALLKQWNEIGRKLIAMAGDFPEDKYDFKAASSTGTFAERTIHGAAANYFFTNLDLGKNRLPRKDVPPSAGKEQIRLDDLAFGLIEHSGEVYGQLSVYYRVAGMIPPESRPKKKDSEKVVAGQRRFYAQAS
jgi:hypothetical protein